MTIPLPEILITGLLTAGFAAVGEVLLGRLSRDVEDGNEAFLVGAGACGAAIFPLSLVLPHQAVIAMLAAMAICGALAIGRRLFHRSLFVPGGPEAATAVATDWTAVRLLLLVAVAAASFEALNFRYNFLWDGFQIWASRAQILYHEGGLSRWWYPGESYETRLLTYPALVPLFEAMLSTVRGAFDFDVLKPVFPVFHLSILLSVFAAARPAAGARAALYATALVAFLPSLSTRWAAGAYADMPQAAFVAGTVAAALGRRQRGNALPWLIGGLTTVKAEGTLLSALAIAAVLLAWILDEPRRFLRRLRENAWPIVIVAGFLAAHFAYLRWLGVTDPVYGPFDSRHLARAAARLRHVAALCGRVLLDPRQWGLLWPAFFAAGLLLAFRGLPRQKSLAIATAVGTAVFAVPFLFTDWPVELHVSQAYFRLLAQLAPAAAVCMVIGFRRAKGATGESVAP